jgi:hypothetical protein
MVNHDAMYDVLLSDCELDASGSQGANVVDALYEIARALQRVANAITKAEIAE